MKIAIVGYGKMGKEVERSARVQGILISRIVESDDDLRTINFGEDEVAIEFTSPEACFNNLKTLIEKKVPIVCGTTGWTHRASDIEDLVEKSDSAFLYGSNFSVGVHLFWKTLEQLSKNMNMFEEYQVSAEETHHIHKKDKPSGTARTVSKIVTNNIDRVSTLEFNSIREGEVFGDHRILFDSSEDTIELSHKAKNRSGFAKGAVASAQWLYGKKGFFTIEDFMREKFA